MPKSRSDHRPFAELVGQREYAFIDTPNKPTTFTASPGVSFTAVMHQQINQITAGVNYRF